MKQPAALNKMRAGEGFKVQTIANIMFSAFAKQINGFHDKDLNGICRCPTVKTYHIAEPKMQNNRKYL
jgi:hypothetical protein